MSNPVYRISGGANFRIVPEPLQRLIMSAVRIPIFLKYILAWFGMVILAIINGTLRVELYGPLISELTAHQLSTLSALFIFGLYIRVLGRIWPLPSAKLALLIGAAWVCMTIAFEFLFGHYAIGHSWHKLFHDYNLLAGRVWLLVLIWTGIAPYVFYRLRT